MCDQERPIGLLEGHEELVHFFPGEEKLVNKQTLRAIRHTDRSGPNLRRDQVSRRWRGRRQPRTLVTSALLVRAHRQILHQDVAMS